MPIYTDPDKPQVRPRIITAYVDDSACDIGGVQHTLLGGIAFYDEGEAVAAVLDTKMKLGIKPQSEIKWNSKAFATEQRHFLTEQILPILNRTCGFLVISETGKQFAAMELGKQLSDYCRAKTVAGFVLRFDKGIVQDSKRFDQQAYALTPPCIGWTEADSAHDQLIQCADLFVGFQKLRIDFGLGRADTKKLVEVEAYEGIREEYELEWYVRLALRYALWGEVEQPHEPAQPWKNNMGYGVRMFSSIADEVKQRALSNLDREYLGCIH